MFAGVLVGIALNIFGPAIPRINEFLVEGLFYVVGAAFIAMLKLMVVPLVLVSLVCGVNAMGDVRTIGRVGAKTFGLYLITTAIAIVLALSLAQIFSPGAGFVLTGGLTEYIPREAPPLAETIINIFPENPVQAMADGQMLQIIVFALLFGFAANLAGERGKPVVKLFSDLNEVILKMVLMVILLAPIGVFALISRTFATQGIEIFGPLLGYFVAVVVALLVHLGVTYSLILKLSGMSPLKFLTQMRAPMSFGFSTSSSAATIPVTLNTLETRLGVKNSVASFTVPLGATINMDGTAIMHGIATVFIANVYGVDLMLGDYLAVVLTATLASIGTAAVPHGGLIMLAMVLGQVGLPVEGIALIIGVDRLLAMLRTLVNIVGDGAVTCIVARSEGALDLEVFNDPETILDPSLRSVTSKADT
jgi:DAACS family dicarboxylate/amino acid:cation (Na+ or H+) symporter